jgi:hypothetical protein
MTFDIVRLLAVELPRTGRASAAFENAERAQGGPCKTKI